MIIKLESQTCPWAQTHIHTSTLAPPRCYPPQSNSFCASVLGKRGVLSSYQPGHPVVNESCQQHPWWHANRAEKADSDMLNINTIWENCHCDKYNTALCKSNLSFVQTFWCHMSDLQRALSKASIYWQHERINAPAKQAQQTALFICSFVQAELGFCSVVVFVWWQRVCQYLNGHADKKRRK